MEGGNKLLGAGCWMLIIRSEQWIVKGVGAVWQKLEARSWWLSVVSYGLSVNVRYRCIAYNLDAPSPYSIFHIL